MGFIPEYGYIGNREMSISVAFRRPIGEEIANDSERKLPKRMHVQVCLVHRRCGT